MGQLTEVSSDAQNIAKNLIDTIVNEVIKAISERTDSHFDSLENLKLQKFGNEEMLDCVKSEGVSLEEIKGQENRNQEGMSDICYQNLPEVCINSSSLSTSSKQGEGDFQPPSLRETAAFYHFDQEENCYDDNQKCKNSSRSSLNTDTDELIAHLHNDIYNLSFDNIHLTDSDVESGLRGQTPSATSDVELDLSTNNEEGSKTKVDQGCCQASSSKQYFEEYVGHSNNNELRHSPKFCQLAGQFPSPRYFPLKEHCDDNVNGRENEEEQELLSTSSDELFYVKTERENCAGNFPQTNPFTNPFLCSDVHSTIALSSHRFEESGSTGESNRMTVYADVERVGESNAWEEANEVQIKITEPGCSSELLQTPETANDVDVVQTRQYWSNVGLMTERTVNSRYLGPVEIPGIESIKGVTRVEEKILSHEQEREEVMWVTEAETPDDNESSKSSQDISKDDEVNYLSFSNKTEETKKKKKFVSRLTRAISSIFKFKSKDSKV